MNRTFPLEFDPGQFRGAAASEKRLWFAVLMDAIGCLFEQIGSRTDRVEERRHAHAWIADQSIPSGWIVTFDMVCDALGLEPSRLRRALLVGDIPMTAAFDRLARPRKSLIGPIDPMVVFALFADGLPIPMIARRLGTSRKTVHRILGPACAGIRRRRRMTKLLGVAA